MKLTKKNLINQLKLRQQFVRKGINNQAPKTPYEEARLYAQDDCLQSLIDAFEVLFEEVDDAEAIVEATIKKLNLRK